MSREEGEEEGEEGRGREERIGRDGGTLYLEYVQKRGTTHTKQKSCCLL
jgi:hypothetical protein